MRDHASVAARIARKFHEQLTLTELDRLKQDRQTHRAVFRTPARLAVNAPTVFYAFNLNCAALQHGGNTIHAPHDWPVHFKCGHYSDSGPLAVLRLGHYVSDGMLKTPVRSAIRLRGVRQNNLKNFDLDLPLSQLIVITGLSGSGKSSLAFDTLFAEGQRRYIETFSPYARQFLDRMDKPQVDSIEGIPPAIAIEQRNTVKSTRSTVGTMTEICDYMKMLWPHIAQLHCRQCGRPVRKESPRRIWDALDRRSSGAGLGSRGPKS